MWVLYPKKNKCEPVLAALSGLFIDWLRMRFMAEKTRKKPAGAPEKPLEAVPRKSGKPEFTRIADLKDPWEGEKQIEMPEKGEREPERGKGLIAKRETLTNEDIAAKLREIKERVGKKFRYHRGNISERPHKTKETTPTYLDRMSRFGSVAGNRPKSRKAKEPEGEVMDFTKPETKPEKEETKTMVFTLEEVEKYGEQEKKKAKKREDEET